MSASLNMASINEVIELTAPALRMLVAELMATMQRLHPDAHVTAWPKQKIISFGFGPKKMSEHYFYIGVHPKHINAGFYYGAALPDPSSALEGAGKSLRHVKVRKLQDAQAAELLALLEAAKRERALR